MDFHWVVVQKQMKVLELMYHGTGLEVAQHHQTQMEVSQVMFQLILQVDLVLCLIQVQEVLVQLEQV